LARIPLVRLQSRFSFDQQARRDQPGNQLFRPFGVEAKRKPDIFNRRQRAIMFGGDLSALEEVRT